MKPWAFVSLFLLGIAGMTQGEVPIHGSAGAGHGISLPAGSRNPCGGALRLNYDGSAENAYCWQYAGIGLPYGGAFAECYEYTGCVCGIELLLTSAGRLTSTCGRTTAANRETSSASPPARTPARWRSGPTSAPTISRYAIR